MRITGKKQTVSVLIVAAFVAGYGVHYSMPAVSASSAGKPLYYRDPMHPAYRSDRPGIAPDCGMQLEPVYAEAAPPPADTTAPGAIRINYEKQQMMGVTTEAVAAGPGLHASRLSGRVAADESRVFRVTALSEGVVRSASSFGPGSVVRKDDLLATYFVAQRDLYNAFQNFFVANSNIDRGLSSQLDPSVMDAAKAQIRLTEELLQTYGVTETQLRQMATSRQITRDIQFRAPASGIVLSRSVAVGQRLDRGVELFRIADLNRIWVLADVFERDSARIGTGMKARVRYQGRVSLATVTGARDFDPVSRTLKVRLEMDNPGLLLRPDMFVEIELQVSEETGIYIPRDAVLDTGNRAVVFVATAADIFEPREVTTGGSFAGRVRITKGLAAGENVVVSGLFLLDSESRLHLVDRREEAERREQAAPPPGDKTPGGIDPVCGMKVEPAASGTDQDIHSIDSGVTYRFCSTHCKSKFDTDPQRYRTAIASVKAGLP